MTASNEALTSKFDKSHLAFFIAGMLSTFMPKPILLVIIVSVAAITFSILNPKPIGSSPKPSTPAPPKELHHPSENLHDANAPPIPPKHRSRKSSQVRTRANSEIEHEHEHEHTQLSSNMHTEKKRISLGSGSDGYAYRPYG